jgi:LPXTG-motif cell wall-anchored protein
MSSPARRAAASAALAACLAAPCTLARAQARPGSEPPLTSKPPTPLGTPAPTVTPAPTATPARRGGSLPNTGADAGLLALAGVSLLGLGVGLRLRLDAA